MKRRVWLCAAGLVLGLVGPRPAAADPTSCDLPEGANMFVVRYFDAPANDSPLCNQSGDLLACRLSGWIYEPSGEGPFPAVVLNHSAENPRAESDYCPIVEYFVRQGYVLFQPLRRGYGGDGGVGTNTGELPATTLANLTAGGSTHSPLATSLLSGCEYDGDPTLNTFERDCVDMKLQASQALEIQSALRYLVTYRGRSLIDPERIALIGHANGAHITAMSAWPDAADIRLLPVQAAVLLSPGERSWGDDHAYLKNRLIQSVERRAFPIAVLQPVDGLSVHPTEEIAQAAITTMDREFMATLLPAVGGTPAEVQKWFATRAKHVDRWAPIARRFIHIYGVK